FGITWNHLWYLAYLWLYTMVLLVLLPLRKRPVVARMAAFGWPAWLLLSLPVAWLAPCHLWLAPRFPVPPALFGAWAGRAAAVARMAAFGWPAWLLLSLPVAWLATCHLWLAPRFPVTHALFGDWTVHAESLPLFLAGYAIAGNARFWQRVRAWRRPLLAAALACLAVELLIRAGGRYLPPDAAVPAWVPWAQIERIARAGYTW